MTNDWWFSRQGPVRLARQARSGPGSDTLNVRLFRTDANTGSEMIGLDLYELGFDFAASFNRVRTTGVKSAAGWWIDRRRDVTLQHNPST